MQTYSNDVRIITQKIMEEIGRRHHIPAAEQQLDGSDFLVLDAGIDRIDMQKEKISELLCTKFVLN